MYLPRKIVLLHLNLIASFFHSLIHVNLILPFPHSYLCFLFFLFNNSLFIFSCSFFIFFLYPGFTLFVFLTRFHASLSTSVKNSFLSFRKSYFLTLTH